MNPVTESLFHADLQFTTNEFSVVEGQVPVLSLEYEADGALSIPESSGHTLLFIAGSGE